MDVSKILQNVKEKCMIAPQKPILVGVSGGADSLCLLDVLYQSGYTVLAGHVDHQLRPSSANDAKLVKQYCLKRDIPFLLVNVNVAELVQESGISIEEAARTLRYRALMNLAKNNNAQALAVAHQANDQVETVLMHLLRGSGMSGLKGMDYRSILPAFSTEIPIVRPLLGVWREEIDAYCREKGIEYCIDETNLQPTFFRNRIRNKLIPELNTYNSCASEHIWSLTQILSEEDRYLHQLVLENEGSAIIRKGNDFFIIAADKYSRFPKALQRRILRYWLGCLRSDLRDIGWDAVENPLEVMLGKRRKSDWQVLDGVRLTSIANNQWLLFTDSADLGQIWPQVASSETIELPIPGDTDIHSCWHIRSSVYSLKDQETLSGENSVFFDAAGMEGRVIVRSPQSGDRFSPFGFMASDLKLGDFFTNQHIPALARSHWPLVGIGDSILWVAGIRRSAIAPVTTATREVLRIELVRKN